MKRTQKKYINLQNRIRKEGNVVHNKNNIYIYIYIYIHYINSYIYMLYIQTKFI